MCVDCYEDCKTCKGLSKTECLTCDMDTKNRKLLAGECVCRNGYVTKSDICVKCHYSC